MPQERQRRWTLHLTDASDQAQAELPALDGDTAAGIRLPWAPQHTPYLISPAYEYDIALNAFFYSVSMLSLRIKTRTGYARDIAAFLNFLHHARNQTDWRRATEEDHRAYFGWRREEETGPRVAASTWDRELAAVNRFFTWQVAQGEILQSPIAQRQRRSHRAHGRATNQPASTPAARSHSRQQHQLKWIPAASYRIWRDVGLRGYTAALTHDPTFRGRWASRNACFTDFMIRTGLRLTEQASLFEFEVPQVPRTDQFARFLLPAAVAKHGSERWVYVPRSVADDVAEYVAIDRAHLIRTAQSRGRFSATANSLILDKSRRYVTAVGSSRRTNVALLTPEERARVLQETEAGLEPAALWVSEAGTPLSASSWQEIFRKANIRCSTEGVSLRCHAHMLRHSFAVITLEQLQRGHIRSLKELGSTQRGTYVRVFGDPLDWVRRRLGHRSVETTQVYLHALAELEMETRMTLVPDGWDSALPLSSPEGAMA